MQELLGRIARLDPSATLGLRVIACFDELIVGNVNTQALLSAAAALAGCPAGFRHESSARTIRVSPKGDPLPSGGPDGFAASSIEAGDAITVWLERHGDALANDAIILERLAMAVRLRYGGGPREIDNRRHLGVLADREATLVDRQTAATAVGLVAGRRYRTVAAPLFAVWSSHPSGPEDVIATRFGPIHAIVLPDSFDRFEATPCGVGTATSIEHLHQSFRAAITALRLCSPPAEPLVLADDYGGLIDLLAEAGEDGYHADADAIAEIDAHPWGLETVAALVRTQTVREAARLLHLHHSTLQDRLDTIVKVLGFNPVDGLGRSRFGIAWLVHRLRRSTVLDLPAPSP